LLGSRCVYKKNKEVWQSLTSKPEMTVSFAKQLLNIHLKSDSLWIWWVDHYYIPHTSICSLMLRRQLLHFRNLSSLSATKWSSNVEGFLQCNKCSQDGTLDQGLLQPMHMISLDTKVILFSGLVLFRSNGLF